VFGLQWLRKAILRASGNKALHDEAQIYATQLAAAQSAPGRRRGLVNDWYAFTLSFKGVVLKGLEVVFITLTFGSNSTASRWPPSEPVLPSSPWLLSVCWSGLRWRGCQRAA